MLTEVEQLVTRSGSLFNAGGVAGTQTRWQEVRISRGAADPVISKRVIEGLLQNARDRVSEAGYAAWRTVEINTEWL